MEILTTASEIIKKVESSTSGLPLALLITESLVEVKKGNDIVKFRLREFDDVAKKEHLKLMKVVSGNDNHSMEMQEALDNSGRAFTLADLTSDELDSLNKLYHEVIAHFNK